MVQLFPLLASDPVREGTGPAFRLTVFLVAATALAGEVRAGMLTVATWNVENYLPTARRVDGSYRPNYPKPEAEKQALRDSLRVANADVVAFQEMGDEAHLAELQRDLAGEGLDYPHSAWLRGEDAERHVALLSRVPLARIIRHEKVPAKFKGDTVPVRRGVLEVSFFAGTREVTLFVIHLKSRYTERPDDPGAAAQRAAEAVATRDLVLDRFPDPSNALFLIAGDFNDSRDNRPLRALTRKGRTEISKILPATDDRGDAWTHRYRANETYTRVDFILVSPGLETFAREIAIRVLDLPGVREASDHRPVVLTMEWD